MRHSSSQVHKKIHLCKPTKPGRVQQRTKKKKRKINLCWVYCNQRASEHSSPFPQPYIILISTESTNGWEKWEGGEGAEDPTNPGRPHCCAHWQEPEWFSCHLARPQVSVKKRKRSDLESSHFSNQPQRQRQSSLDPEQNGSSGTIISNGHFIAPFLVCVLVPPCC